MAREIPVGIAWAVAFGFIRIVTRQGVLTEPLVPIEALDLVDSWFKRPNVEVVEPGPRHVRIVRDLFAATGLGGDLTTDTHLAALAIEYRAEIHSNDGDFGRFPGLRWSNPLV